MTSFYIIRKKKSIDHAHFNFKVCLFVYLFVCLLALHFHSCGFPQTTVYQHVWMLWRVSHMIFSYCSGTRGFLLVLSVCPSRLCCVLESKSDTESGRAVTQAIWPQQENHSALLCRSLRGPFWKYPYIHSISCLVARPCNVLQCSCREVESLLLLYMTSQCESEQAMDTSFSILRTVFGIKPLSFLCCIVLNCKKTILFELHFSSWNILNDNVVWVKSSYISVIQITWKILMNSNKRGGCGWI